MAKQTISKFVFPGVLGLLVILLGFLLLVVATPLLMPNVGVFAFGISLRALIFALLAFLLVVAAAMFLFVRALRRAASKM